MKNLFIVMLALIIVTPVYSKIKAKHVAGTWSYSVQTPDGTLTGVLKFTKQKKNKLSGEVLTDDGMTITMNKVEIREGDVVYFEVQPDYEVMKVTMSIVDDKYDGMVSISQGDLKVTGEKQK
jgi:hypothetical protein